MSFVRRNEYAVVTAILFFLILVGVSRNRITANVPKQPVPTTVRYYPPPTPVVQVNPSPVRYVPTDNTRRWKRPNYVCGQPLRNVLRFIFTPRWS